MSQPLTETAYTIDESIRKELEQAVEDLVTEDDEPVDNIFSEKQQRLLTEPLYSSWMPPAGDSAAPRTFLAAANVGIFPSVHQPPLVPDMFLSIDVKAPDDLFKKSGRSYFFWEYGKAPEVVVEVVSNQNGNQLGSKLCDYARIGVTYYVVFDPFQRLSREVVRAYELRGRQYELLAALNFPDVGLRMTLWTGSYEGEEGTWLRWSDADGNLIPTGAEAAQLEAKRAERLEAKLRELGVDPDQL